MNNEVLIIMAARGVRGAQRERMIREIMSVEDVSWDGAQPLLAEIEEKARSQRAGFEFPYYVGAGTALVSGAVCLPLVFDHDTAEWFNDRYVTNEVPNETELETWLEVGGWSWNWMEPLIGTASFLLLLMQFSRAQLLTVRFMPYGRRIVKMQLVRLKKIYPQYHTNVLEDFIASI